MDDVEDDDVMMMIWMLIRLLPAIQFGENPLGRNNESKISSNEYGTNSAFTSASTNNNNN